MMIKITVLSLQQKLSEDLLLYSVQSIVQLFAKVEQVTELQIDKVGQLFITEGSLKVREALSKGLNKILDADVGAQLISINRIKSGSAEIETDFDSCLQGLANIKSVKANLSSKILLFYNVLFFINNREFAIREQALTTFQELLTETDFFKGQKSERLFIQLIHICSKQIEKSLSCQDELQLKTNLETFREFIIFTKKEDITVAFQQSYQPLFTLINQTDENEDFFKSFLSIKIKSRMRALNQLQKNLKDFNQKTILSIVLPLVDFLIFSQKKNIKENKNNISYNIDQRRSLLDKALDTYQILAEQLNWPQYYSLLKKLLHKLQKIKAKIRSVAGEDPHAKKEKLLTKCISKMLLGFSFDNVPDAVEILKQKSIEKAAQEGGSGLSKIVEEIFKEDKEEIPMDTDESDSDDEVAPKKKPWEVEELPKGILDQAQLMDEEQIGTLVLNKPIIKSNEALVEDIQQKLSHKVLPLLSEHIMENETTVRPNVLVAVAMISRRLTPHKFTSQLYKLFALLATGLRSKLLPQRDRARKGCVRLIEAIGPEFLTPMLKEIASQLSKGYQVQVLNFSIHHILVTLCESGVITQGSIESELIQELTPLLIDEMMGFGAEKFEVEDAQKNLIKEAKMRKSTLIYEILASHMNVDKSFIHLIQPIMEVLDNNPTVKKISHCEELLNRIATHLLKNQTLVADQLLVMVYSIVKKGLENASINHADTVEQEEVERYRLSKKEQKWATYEVKMHWVKGRQSIIDKKTVEVTGRVIATFGLQCFKKAVKIKDQLMESKESSDIDEEWRKMLDPFVPLLLMAFRTYHMPLVISTLQILSGIVRFQLPCMSYFKKKFVTKIFKQFDDTYIGDADFLNSMFKCLTEFLKAKVFEKLTEHQLKTLMRIIKANLDQYSTQNNVFSCLKAVVLRKFVCSEIYDIMERVQEMLVIDVMPSTRTTCCHIFVQFLVTYPLESKRIKQHLNHLLKNTGYESSAGRVSVLEAIKLIVERFPLEVLDNYSELLFFTCTLRLANDQNMSVKKQTFDVLRKLLGRTDKWPQMLANILQVHAKCQDVDEDEEYDEQFLQKRDLLEKTQIHLLSLFVQTLGQTKLNSKDVVQIYDACLISILKECEVWKASLVEDNKQLQNKEFYKEVGLIDTKEEQEMDESMILYYGLLTLDRIYTSSSEKVRITQLIMSNSELKEAFKQLLGYNGISVKNAILRVFGHLFQNTPSNNNEFNSIDLLKSTVRITTYIFATKDMAEQAIKNTIFLCKMLLNSGQSLNEFLEYVNRIGKNQLRDFNQACISLKYLLQFIQVLVELFSTEYKSQLDSYSQQLVYLSIKINRDQNFVQTEINQTSSEIIESLRSLLPKSQFISSYATVQKQIDKKTLENRTRHKSEINTKEEIERLKNKRKQKMVRKKAEQSKKIKMHKLDKKMTLQERMKMK